MRTLKLLQRLVPPLSLEEQRAQLVVVPRVGRVQLDGTGVLQERPGQVVGAGQRVAQQEVRLGLLLPQLDGLAQEAHREDPVFPREVLPGHVDKRPLQLALKGVARLVLCERAGDVWHARHDGLPNELGSGRVAARSLELQPLPELRGGRSAGKDASALRTSGTHGDLRRADQRRGDGEQEVDEDAELHRGYRPDKVI